MRQVARALTAVGFLVFGYAIGRAAEPPPAVVATFLERHCVDCHGPEEPEGDVSLAGLAGVDATNAATWQTVRRQIAVGEMPPDDADRPALADREAVITALERMLHSAGFPPQPTTGERPEDGNLLDHERLFSGRHRGPAFSPPRFWRRSQSQYDTLMESLWVLPKLRYEKSHRRNDPKWAAYGYSQPFPGLEPEQFTNYSGEIHADEAVLRALLEAGGQIAERLTSDDVAYANELQPPIAVGVPSIRRGSPFERFKQDPPQRPVEFEPFLAEKTDPTDDEQRAAVARVFEMFLSRRPDDQETKRYGRLLGQLVEKNGPRAAIRGLITAVVVSPEFVFRMEVGLGREDEHGRRMLSPNELLYAIAAALTDAGPDEALRRAAAEGRLRTKDDVAREVRRMLADDRIEKSRRLRFFQEFFGYHRAVDVFKDPGGWKLEVQYIVRDADLLVEHVLEQDERVLETLLTTDRYFVAYPKIDDPELFAAVIQKTIDQTEASIKKSRDRGKEIAAPSKGQYSRAWAHLQGRALIPNTVHNDAGSKEYSYIHVYGIDGSTFEWTPNQPIEVPGRRAGLLTHPAWLVAHSTNSDNDVVGRGHWIRERLLAGRIPDVPIDVAAMVPDEPEHTLRHRMRVTREDRCLRCHRRMDPLGLPFEMYDHFGHFREREMVGTKKNVPKPVDATGAILFSGDPELDGPVEDAIDLVHRLAESPRVRQSFVRHAFRYWMGRNETLHDSPTLIAADEAYVKSGGSFDALLVSLLTSDSFLYRKSPAGNEPMIAPTATAPDEEEKP